VLLLFSDNTSYPQPQDKPHHPAPDFFVVVILASTDIIAESSNQTTRIPARVGLVVQSGENVSVVVILALEIVVATYVFGPSSSSSWIFLTIVASKLVS
jgi:hypothetical protein